MYLFLPLLKLYHAGLRIVITRQKQNRVFLIIYSDGKSALLTITVRQDVSLLEYLLKPWYYELILSEVVSL